ncbi:MAG: septum formation initiator family protein, partial [Gallicola sp.]|nr:septum formation initiator family protein [Gallicola sp.]
KLKDKRNTQNKEIEIRNAKIKGLEEEIASGGTLKFIERIARDEYSMVKPKEVIFIDKNREQNPFKND